jgi:hypothetical protein
VRDIDLRSASVTCLQVHARTVRFAWTSIASFVASPWKD